MKKSLFIFMAIVLAISVGFLFWQNKGEIKMDQAKANSAGESELIYAQFDIFEDHASWPQANAKKADDSFMQAVWPLYTYGSDVRSTLTDINGDGLIDIIKHYGWTNNLDKGGQFAVWLNKGKVKFELAYKCQFNVGFNSDTATYYQYWYGDCAAI